ncbi:MAG: hypothetical protein R2698_06320 [Microthrixaceae bacterium]
MIEQSNPRRSERVPWGRRPIAALVGAAALALVAVGCGGDTADANSAATAKVPGVSTTAPGTSGSVAESGTSAPVPSSAVDADRAPAVAEAGPTTSLLAAKAGNAGKVGENQAGKTIALDETALLACAKAQIATVEIDQGATDDALADLRAARDRALASKVGRIASFADELSPVLTRPADARPVAVRLVSACQELGFEY